MTKLSISKLITSAAVLALIAGFSPVFVSPAFAAPNLSNACADGNVVPSLQCGDFADASGSNGATAIGDNSVASGSFSTALGEDADATASDTLAVGNAAAADAADATAVGTDSDANGINSTAIGSSSVAGGGDSTALGFGANAAGQDSTALGSAASALLSFTTAVGNSSNAQGVGSTALGYSANAAGVDSTALGRAANAAGDNSTALGWSASAAGESSTALGAGANAPEDGSIALGFGTNSSGIAGTNSIALGRYARSTGIYAIAIGSDAGFTFIGANAAGSQSIVIGRNTSDGAFDDALVIGTGAVATEADQVILKDASTFTILGNGNVGMGTGTPGANLDIDSGAADTTLLLTNASAQWELKSKASTGRLNFKNLTAGGVPFKLGPMAVNSLLSVGTAANDLVEVRGKLDVDGDVTVTGTVTTGGPTCGGGCDAVFNDDYDLPSIEDHAAQMYANKHLPAVGPTVPLAPVNLSERMGTMLNELEKAHIYIAQVNANERAMQAKFDQQALELARMKQQIEQLMNP